MTDYLKAAALMICTAACAVAWIWVSEVIAAVVGFPSFVIGVLLPGLFLFYLLCLWAVRAKP